MALTASQATAVGSAAVGARPPSLQVGALVSPSPHDEPDAVGLPLSVHHASGASPPARALGVSGLPPRPVASAMALDAAAAGSPTRAQTPAVAAASPAPASPADKSAAASASPAAVAPGLSAETLSQVVLLWRHFVASQRASHDFVVTALQAVTPELIYSERERRVRTRPFDADVQRAMQRVKASIVTGQPSLQRIAAASLAAKLDTFK